MINKDDIKISYVDINQLKNAEYNPRKANEREFVDLQNSLKRFGFVDPVLVNSNEKRKDVIIGGHFRVAVAKKLGIKKVPVVYVDISDLDEEKELNLRLNKNSGGWDWSMLADMDEALLRAVGFENRDLKKLIGGEVAVEAEEEFTTEVLEENNYLVFTFDNSLDWSFVKEQLGISTVQALDSRKGYERKGVGRVLDGKRLIKLLNK